MFRALLRTATKICDSEKAAYSFLNMIGACVLHVCFDISVKDALLLVSPLSFLTLAQAYVDAAAARQPKSGSTMQLAVPLPPMPSESVVPPVPGGV